MINERPSCELLPERCPLALIFPVCARIQNIVRKGELGELIFFADGQPVAFMAVLRSTISLPLKLGWMYSMCTPSCVSAGKIPQAALRRRCPVSRNPVSSVCQFALSVIINRLGVRHGVDIHFVFKGISAPFDLRPDLFGRHFTQSGT